MRVRLRPPEQPGEPIRLRVARPPAGAAFDPGALPDGASDARQTAKQTAEQLQTLQEELRARDERLAVVLADRAALDEELERLRAEVAQAKKRAAERPDAHDYSETETRDLFIDLLLREAGWPLADARDREYPVIGMPNREGKGFVDYVLWGDDGRPLALVEAKRTRRDPRVGQEQARLYADCLEKEFGRRPLIFYTNGYEHWIWDDARYPPRRVQGFYKKGEVELLLQRRETRRSLASAAVDTRIVERYYQERAIRRIAEAFERDHQRKALIVMATGAGKTRTVIALCDLLMRCNWVKRVLFLADRIALVNQAVNAFKAHLPDAPPVNLVTERDGDGRVYVSTYPTMMNSIDDERDDEGGTERRFGAGFFDLVIIDEAHRSVYQKYRALFEYFDSFLVGLTATPTKDVDHNTYSLFDLEDGVPTDAYDLQEAVRDGFLVPPRAVSVPLQFHREGIAYKDLTEDEKDQWDALEWDDGGNVPDRVEPPAVNQWLFNEDTVDKVLAHLMSRGIKVAGGDRLGKTIVFAKNQAHADFIAERFNVAYPHLRGTFARVITFKTEYAQSLIDRFALKESPPHLAISVDMLDTGIDVPEVVNLAFFKLVRSKTKFWQMVGRGTRLCPDLFGPGEDKDGFQIFDYCENLEFFSQDLPTTEGASSASLGKRLFDSRLELLGALDQKLLGTGAHAVVEPASVYFEPRSETEVRADVSAHLHREVAAMSLDNFLVRPHRRTVERFAKAEAWLALRAEDRGELSHEVAGLPTELEAEVEESKRFDLLVLHLQLARLRDEPGFARLRDKVKAIAGLLEEKSAIPIVRDQLPLILELQTDEWWEDVTLPMLEAVRRRLRDLVPLIEKRSRKALYADFVDEIGGESEYDLGGLAKQGDFARFRAKAMAFLREHLNHVAIHRLRTNRPLTAADLRELERMLLENGVGDAADLERAARDSQGLGLFVRSLVGLERIAAKVALSAYLDERTLSSTQIEFLNLIVDNLTERGVVDPARLYESPFTDVSPRGPEGIFTMPQVESLVQALHAIRATASVA